MPSLNPRDIIDALGLIGVALIVFGESSVMVGFLLPGDSLLFTAGLLSSQGRLAPFPILLAVCFAAATSGDQVGYVVGQRIGPRLFRKQDSRLFKQAHVARAHDFFERHGPKAIVLARFLPLIRTLVPILAGVGHMRYRTFVLFNVIGALAWAVGVTSLGYTLGATIPDADRYLLPMIGVIIAASMTPPLLAWRRARRAVAVVEP